MLKEDPAKMSAWIGQPSVKGSSEMMRMVLLTFNSVGITSIHSALCHRSPSLTSLLQLHMGS